MYKDFSKGWHQLQVLRNTTPVDTKAYKRTSCSFGLPRVPFVNCCQLTYLVISRLVLRAGYGIWLYQFLIIAYRFTFYLLHFLIQWIANRCNMSTTVKQSSLLNKNCRLVHRMMYIPLQTHHVSMFECYTCQETSTRAENWTTSYSKHSIFLGPASWLFEQQHIYCHITLKWRSLLKLVSLEFVQYYVQGCILIIWGTTWQNQQSDCAPNEDLDQPGHPPNLIRVFAVCMKKAWVLSYPLGAQRRHRSDWAGAQADLILRWAHSHFFGFVMSRLNQIIANYIYMSLVTRKPVFGVCDQVRHKPACTAAETTQGLEILDIASIGIILSKQWSAKALIRLRGCAAWSARLLFAYSINSFSHDVAHLLLWNWSNKAILPNI